jgi:ParB-like chromosome segregation protein Spo0J
MSATDTKVATEPKVARTYEFHPFADLFPMLDKDSVGFKALIEDIKANRQHEPVLLYEGKILDGRNRYNACQHLGKDVLTRDYTGSDPIGFVLSINLHRRHLNTSQRAMVAAKLANLKDGANQHSEGTSIEVASKLLNVGRASIERARQVLARGDPSLIEEVEQGTTTVTAAAAPATGSKGGGKGGGKGTEKASDKYDKAETKLIEKLQDLKPTEAEAAATETIKKLRATVATMLKAAATAKAA